MWDQNWPHTPWVTSWNQRNRNVESICGENDSGERSRAIMAILFLYIANLLHKFDEINLNFTKLLLSENCI